MPPEGSIDTHVHLPQEFIQKHTGNDIVILSDLNAKISVWGNSLLRSDVRGDDVLTFFIQNELMIMNYPASETTFQSVRGDSWIDLSLASLHAPSAAVNWEIDNREKATDYIILLIAISTDIPN